MASASVYYKFKSQKEPSRITFDGTGISVWDLKREIILQNKMGRGTDFDLGVYNADTNDEYKDDNYLIPRSTQVIARRLPPAKPGRGSAQLYVSDVNGGADTTGASRFSTNANAGGVRPPENAYRGPMSMRFDATKAASPVPSSSSGTGAPLNTTAAATGGEADSIAAMFQASSAQWDETQERMSHATYRDRSGQVRRGGPPRPMTTQRPPHLADRPPPNGYVCFRCGKPGHWIQECPTNDDKDFDNRPRFKRTTGIPKSMLKTVEQPTDEDHRAGVMLTADGTYVVAQVDSESWRKNRVRTKPLTQSDVYQSTPTNTALACPLCSKLLRDAVKTPCCGTKYCEECIQTHLLEHEFICAECERRIPDLDQLRPDEEARKSVREYIKETIEQSERDLEEDAKRDEEGRSRPENPQPSASASVPQSTNLDTTTSVRDEDVHKTGNSSTDLSYGEAANASTASNDAMAMFNPQMVQQIMMMLQNPALPPPMRMQLQMQLQMQQFAFMQMQMQAANSGAGASGTPNMTGMMHNSSSRDQHELGQSTNEYRAPSSGNHSPHQNVARASTEKRDRPSDFAQDGNHDAPAVKSARQN